MTEREFLINFERQLMTMVRDYSLNYKIDSDTIFHYINKTKDAYVKEIYRSFQLNQEMSDKIRTLVTTKEYCLWDFERCDNKYMADYPEDYVFALGERATATLDYNSDNKCPNLAINAGGDVIEATIETVDKILSNSLSEYHLHHNQAKPVRVYTDNKIVLYTDGNYVIKSYELTYLRKAKDLGKDLLTEYTDLPEHTHQEIIDAAVNMYITLASALASKKQED